MSSQSVHELQLTPHLALISTSPRKILKDQPLKRFATSGSLNSNGEEYRLCIMIGWFMAKTRHTMKFAQFYLDQDFDVLMFNSTASQLFMPVSSPKNTALDILDFCYNNQHYGPIVVHSFSVGAMAWGYLLHYVNENSENFKFLHEKIVGQVWDSPFVNMERLPKVASSNAFPKNCALRKAMETYLAFHMKTRITGSTFCRYAAQAFLHLNTTTQFLLFTSENDSTSLCSAVAECAEEWKNHGSIVYWKIWHRSTHVCHMRENPEEYTTLLREFLDRISVLKYPDRFKILSSRTTKEDEGFRMETSQL